MDNIKENYENLYQFLACYFTEDFSTDYREPELATAQFIKDNDLGVRRTVVAQIHEILDKYDENELDAVIYRLGCYYSPQKYKNISVSEWLKQLIVQIENAIVEESKRESG